MSDDNKNDNVTELRPKDNFTAQSEDVEILTILDRDGAIETLRNIRNDIRGGALSGAGFSLAPPARQIDLLYVALEDAISQLYAVSIMLSGVLGDPTLHDEVNRDLQGEE